MSNIQAGAVGSPPTTGIEDLEPEEGANEKRIRVLVVDDHLIYTRGLIHCLSLESDIECIGAANSGQQALELVANLQPDVVVLDVFLPGLDGPTLAYMLRERYPHVAMIALSGFGPDDLVLKMVRAGVDGYLLKSCDRTEIVHAIRVVARGESYLTPTITSALMRQVRQLSKVRHLAGAQHDGLTERELKVLELLASGKSNREIAEMLCLSERTAENHTRNIYRKLRVHDRTQATLVALQKGYVELFTVQVHGQNARL